MLRRLIHGVAATAAGQWLNIIGNLLVVPLFLSRWPSGIYGEWMALASVVAYFGITDLGMNSAAANGLAAAYARDDMARYRRLQATAMVFYLGIALLGSVAAGILLHAFVPVTQWLGIQQIAPSTAATVAWLLAVRILAQMPAAQITGIYRSIGKLAATQWLGNLQSFGLLMVTIAVLLMGGSPADLAAWSIVPMVVATAAAWFSLRCSNPHLLPKLALARLRELGDLLRPSLLFSIIMASMTLTLQGPVLVTSKAFGGAAVALLVTTRTLTNLTRQIVTPLQIALWPELTRLEVVGEEETLRLGHRLLVTGSVGLAAAFAGTLWFEGSEVITVWTRGRLAPDIWLLRLLLFSTVPQAVWVASSLFLMANNKHQRLARSYAASSVLSVIIMALLVRSFGLLAIPLGMIAGEALACYHFVTKDACRLVEEQYGRFAARLWTTVVAMLFATWCAAYAAHSLASGPALWRWIQVATLSALAAGGIAWRFGLVPEDRSRLIGWARAKRLALRPVATIPAL